MIVYLLTSSDREHGGCIIHGVFQTYEAVVEARDKVNSDYYRIATVTELKLDELINESDE